MAKQINVRPVRPTATNGKRTKTVAYYEATWFHTPNGRRGYGDDPETAIGHLILTSDEIIVKQEK